VPIKIPELPPEIIGTMKNVTIAKGERATFEIELTKGDALVRWFKDGKELQFSEHVQLAIDGKRQRLMVYNSVPDDDGEYSCQVGEQTSRATLKVEEPAVEFVIKLPEVTLTPQNTDAIFTVELSQPGVEVSWLKNGKPLTASDKVIFTADGCLRQLILKKVAMED
jgi:Immunoglobulin I-set domain